MKYLDDNYMVIALLIVVLVAIGLWIVSGLLLLFALNLLGCNLAYSLSHLLGAMILTGLFGGSAPRFARNISKEYR